MYQLKIVALLSLLLVSQPAKQASSDYLPALKEKNISFLWRNNKLRYFGEDDITIPFPEPLGFIGGDYRRFYIHYLTVQKDTANPFCYLVTGKTRVGNNICNFTGSITITKARLLKVSDSPNFKQGYLTANVDFKEGQQQKGSGEIKGVLTTYFMIDKKGQIYYNTINSYADSWDNNQCEATWTSYSTHQSKKCNWGDWRIPQSGDLDIGAGEFSVNDKYLSKGWQTFRDLYHKDAAIAKKAKAEEARKWWQ